MTALPHHVQSFAGDLDASGNWYQDLLGGVAVCDREIGGARHVFMKIEDGRLRLYDQAPSETGRNAVHHIGIRTDDLASLVERS